MVAAVFHEPYDKATEPSAASSSLARAVAAGAPVVPPAMPAEPAKADGYENVGFDRLAAFNYTPPIVGFASIVLVVALNSEAGIFEMVENAYKITLDNGESFTVCDISRPFMGIRVVDANGVVRFGTGQGVAPINVTDRDYFQRLKALPRGSFMFTLTPCLPMLSCRK